MADELKARLDALEQLVVQQVAGQMLEQGIDHLLTAQVAFMQVGELNGLREDMRSYALEMVKLLAPVVEQGGLMARQRADALTEKENAENA